MVKANGTIAKDIALYFLDITTDRYTPSIVAKTVRQAKQLLEAGYTKEEIISVIDYITTRTNVKMYSLGYVNYCINEVLDKINEEEKAKQIQEIIEQAKKEQATVFDRGDIDNDSTRRNREKVNRLNVQSRVRKKFDFDMFER